MGESRGLGKRDQPELKQGCREGLEASMCFKERAIGGKA